MGRGLDYIMDYHQGRLKLGIPYGEEELNKHWLFKRNLTIVLGIAGAGKTSLLHYMQLVASLLTGKKCISWTAENSPAGIQLELMSALLGTNMKNIAADKVEGVFNLLAQYVEFVDTEVATNMYDVIEAFKRKSLDDYQSIIIDPFSALKIDYKRMNKRRLSEYRYHYESITDLRAFQKECGKAIFLCVHPSTGKARNKHPDGHKYAGMTMPLSSSDAENGSMFDNRADDYVVAHRYKQHPEDYKYTELHVLKVKELLTGGQETSMDYPLKFYKDRETHRWYINGVDILQKAIDKAKIRE